MRTFLRRSVVVAFLLTTVGLPVLSGLAVSGEPELVPGTVIAVLAAVLTFWGVVWVAWKMGGYLVRTWRGPETR